MTGYATRGSLVKSAKTRRSTVEQIKYGPEGERGLATFVDVGLALLEIRDRRIYRETYKTFEDYCRERWGWERAHVYRLISTAKVERALVELTHTTNWLYESEHINLQECHARELARLDDPDEMREVYQEVREEHDKQVTARDIRQTRKNPLRRTRMP